MNSVLDYGAVADGVTNDSPAFVACQAANACFRVPHGVYALNDTVPVLSGKKWFGENATLTHSDPTKRILESIVQGGWSLRGFTLKGKGTGAANATNQGEVGLYADSGQNFSVIDVRGDLFDGRAFVITGAQSGPFHGDAGVLERLGCTGNWLAAEVPAIEGGGSQYTIFKTLQLVGNRQAMRVAAGNCIIDTSNIVMNQYGLELAKGPNHGHGIVSSSNINHNTEWNLHAKDITLGYTLNANHFYGDSPTLGKIILIDSAGVIFNGGKIDCRVENSGPYLNAIKEASFPGSFFSRGGANPTNLDVTGYTPTTRVSL